MKGKTDRFYWLIIELSYLLEFIDEYLKKEGFELPLVLSLGSLYKFKQRLSLDFYPVVFYYFVNPLSKDLLG